MPLQRSCSKDAFENNIKAEMRAGKDRDQAVAIAFSTLKKACGVSSGFRGSADEIIAKQESISGHRYPDMGRRPKGPGPYSPQGGYRAPQPDGPLRANKRRRKGKKKPFVDPDDFTLKAHRMVPLSVLMERSNLTYGKPLEARKKWLGWLWKLIRRADEAHKEGAGKSKFSAGLHTRKLKDMLDKYVKGQVPVPPDTRQEGKTYDSLFSVTERISHMGSFGVDLTHPPMGRRRVGTSKSASGYRGSSDFLGRGDTSDARFRSHVPVGSASVRDGDPRYKGKVRRTQEG